MVNLPNFLKYGRDAEIQLMHQEDTIIIKKKKIRIYNQLHKQLHALMNQDGHNNILQPIINNNNNQNQQFFF